MKFKNQTIIFSSLLFLILTSGGVIISVRALESQQHNTWIAWTKNSQPLPDKNPSTQNPTYPSEVLYLSTAHVEPLLLFMLGAGLLLIVTGIKMIHSRRLRLPLDSASSSASATPPPLRLPLSKGKRASNS